MSPNRTDIEHAALTTRWVRAMDVSTPVSEAGALDAREAVVYVHGNPGSRRDFGMLVASTGTFVRSIAFDMPGFGEADKPRDFEYSVEGFGRFIDEVLGRLGIERVHLVVHDFGTAYGLHWAVTYPNAFASVVVINGPPVSDYRWYALARVWRTPVAGEVLHGTLTRPFFELNVRRGNPKRLPDEFVGRMWREYDRGTRRAVLGLYRATPANRMVPAGPAEFAALGRPALVVWGSNDAYIPRRFAEQHREAFPGVEIVDIPHASHWPMVDQPRAVGDAVVPFLRGQVEGGA